MNRQEQNRIREIVDELISLEPALAGKRLPLEKIVASMLALKPDVAVDKKFILALKRRLQEKAENYAVEGGRTSLNNFWEGMFMKKLSLVAVTTLVIVLVIAGGAYVYNQQAGLRLASDVEINKTGNEAFGSLAALVGQAGGFGGGGGSDAIVGAGGGGSGTEGEQDSAISTRPQSGGGFGGGGFLPETYSFKYTGEEFSIPDAQMDVYRKIKGFGQTISFSSILSRFKTSLVDLNKLKSSNLQSISFAEDREFGYAIYIDFNEGAININENWQKWQTPDRLCRDQACFEQNRVGINEVPSDASLIAIANQFLDDYEINRNDYGEPVVQNFWRIQYEQAENKTDFYIPDYQTVIYPFKFGGNEIYDEGGNLTGLTVGINIRVNKVASVSMLTSQRYEASAYPVEQDTEKLIQLAERGGGIYGYYPLSESAGNASATIELGTPRVELIRMWRYDQIQPQELLVPSLVFPIQVKPDAYWGNNVVVPLARDIIESLPGPITIQ